MSSSTCEISLPFVCWLYLPQVFVWFDVWAVYVCGQIDRRTEYKADVISLLPNLIYCCWAIRSDRSNLSWCNTCLVTFLFLLLCSGSLHIAEAKDLLTHTSSTIQLKSELWDTCQPQQVFSWFFTFGFRADGAGIAGPALTGPVLSQYGLSNSCKSEEKTFGNW